MTDPLSTHLAEGINRVNARLDGHEQRLQAMEKSEAGMSVWRTNISEQLKAIQDGNRWILRTILGGIVIAVVGFLVSGGFNVQ